MTFSLVRVTSMTMCSTGVQRGAQDEVAGASPKAAGGRHEVVQEDDEGEPRFIPTNHRLETY